MKVLIGAKRRQAKIKLTREYHNESRTMTSAVDIRNKSQRAVGAGGYIVQSLDAIPCSETLTTLMRSWGKKKVLQARERDIQFAGVPTTVQQWESAWSGIEPIDDVKLAFEQPLSDPLGDSFHGDRVLLRVVHADKGNSE